MSVEDNKAIVGRLIDEGWNRADLGAIDAGYATDYVNHDPDNPAAEWPSLKEEYRGYFAAFPDAHNVIDDLIGEGDGSWLAGRRGAPTRGRLQASLQLAGR
jgi:hypothetical protein